MIISFFSAVYGVFYVYGRFSNSFITLGFFFLVVYFVGIQCLLLIVMSFLSLRIHFVSILGNLMSF